MLCICPRCGWRERNSHPEPCAMCHTPMVEADLLRSAAGDAVPAHRRPFKAPLSADDAPA